MSDAPRTLAVLGSTGSIGVQTLEVAARETARVRVTALAAGRSLEALAAQAAEVRPGWIALEQTDDPAAAGARLEAASPGARVRVGIGAAAWIAAESGAETVVNGVVGAAGLRASLATLERGACLALANKETLVVGKELVRAALARGGGVLLPIDSEHSGLLQCALSRPAAEIARMTVTASGGPLRHHADWRRARVEEVLAHPVWAMGERITVDSALLFNKGLEILEAHALFGLPFERLDAVIHPQARVHAIVTFRDGSMLIQAARPDMRLPIQLALSWPEHWSEAVSPLIPADLAGLEFEPVEAGRFPAFDLALAAGRAGGTAPCVLNAADEVAVRAFLAGEIPLGEVPELIERVLEMVPVARVESLEQLEAVDARARALAREELART